MADRYDERHRNEPYRNEPYRNEPYRNEGGREDRGFMDRAGDEVRSWFGDEEAERRRRLDERERERYFDRDWNRGQERGWNDRTAGESGRGSERWSADYGRIEYDRPNRGYYGGSRSGSESYGSRYGNDYGSSRSWSGGYGQPYGTGSYGNRPYGGGSYGTGSFGSGWREARFAGKGPKGYQRPDNRISEDVCDRLADAPDVDASNIEVKVNNGEVTLGGTVDDRWNKRRAEEIIEDISGVREVHNNLRVSRQGENR